MKLAADLHYRFLSRTFFSFQGFIGQTSSSLTRGFQKPRYRTRGRRLRKRSRRLLPTAMKQRTCSFQVHFAQFWSNPWKNLDFSPRNPLLLGFPKINASAGKAASTTAGWKTTSATSKTGRASRTETATRADPWGHVRTSDGQFGGRGRERGGGSWGNQNRAKKEREEKEKEEKEKERQDRGVLRGRSGSGNKHRFGVRGKSSFFF